MCIQPVTSNLCLFEDHVDLNLSINSTVMRSLVHTYQIIINESVLFLSLLLCPYVILYITHYVFLFQTKQENKSLLFLYFCFCFFFVVVFFPYNVKLAYVNHVNMNFSYFKHFTTKTYNYCGFLFEIASFDDNVHYFVRLSLACVYLYILQ